MTRVTRPRRSARRGLRTGAEGRMSRSRLPSSRIKLSRQVLFYDLFCAAAAPIAAYFIRDPNVLNFYEVTSLAIYAGVSVCISAFSFRAFRVAQGLPRFLSFHDVVEIAKASALSVVAISAFLFSFTRLDDVPRSVPIIHFLVLTGMLVAGRLIWRSLGQRQDLGAARYPTVEQEEAVFLVGVNRLAWFYVRILDTFALGHRRVVGLLDTNRALVGRSLYGHFVLGEPQNAGMLVDDFASHGIPVAAFVICERRRDKAAALRAMIQECADRRGIAIEMLAEELGVDSGDDEILADIAVEPPVVRPMPAYFRLRRAVDATLSGLAITMLLPVFGIVALSVYVALDAPVIFWQRRVGRNGRPIYVYKFRSMRNPVDSSGRVVSDAERVSKFGSFLRATRLDELPQLFNVLRGDMAIIGPRPLLPVDQPDQAALRLSVPPGITGWAQIHGGKLISVDEKNALDEFYVRNASLRLDAAIVLKTVKTVLLGDRRDESLAKALDRGGLDVQGEAEAAYVSEARRVA